MSSNINNTINTGNSSSADSSSTQANSNVDYSRPNLAAKSWPIGEDVVISGIGGRFPEADNIDELAANLLAGVDMVTRDDRRWPVGLNANEASRSGKVKALNTFDSAYFCTLGIIADNMDPGSRIILETTYEAIADAGIAPQAIRGTKTGVYCGINTVACAEAIPQDDFSDIRAKDAAFWVYGSSKALLANRISFLFDLIGPSTVIDTACSSSLVALCNAVADIRSGVAEMAIVATCNLCLAPYSSHVFSSLGLLAADGKCKVFDKDADGFVRSETVGALLLQRRSQAKRIYATVAHAKTNTDGFKTIGLFAPFWLRQRNLMIETFQEAGVDPHSVRYFESHGTGTNVGDPQEAKAVSEAYCLDRKDKLLVGAVKSNLGHSEGASGLNSVAKAIIIFETGTIPANLHFREAKPEIECLHRTIEPVVVNLPFEGELIGVNSFGVGGVNAHVLLRMNPKTAEVGRLLEIADPIPRLVTACGRTEEAVNAIFDFIEQNPNKAHADFLALLNDAMKTSPIRGSGNFPHRGYMVLKKKNKKKETEKDENQKPLGTSVAKVEDLNHLVIPPYECSRVIETTKRTEPLWLLFSGMGSQWTGMGRQMLQLEVFRRSLEASAEVLRPLGVDLLHLLTTEESSEKVWESSVVNPFVAITAMQIALFEVVARLDLPIAGIIGHSFGEIACAFADNCLTAEQAILASYWRGQAVALASNELPEGLMIAVGLTWAEAKRYADETDGVYLACHNGTDSVTLSGRREPILGLMERLQAENVFVRQVAGGQYPYHSREMEKVGPRLLARLKEVIPNPKPRSSRWVSTSVLESSTTGSSMSQTTESNHGKGKGNLEIDKDKAEGSEVNGELPSSMFASGEYFVNNLISPVLFAEGMRRVPKRAICIEVAPHALFDSIFKRCYPDLSYISLMRRAEPDNLSYFLSALGRVYTFGFNPAIETLYPKVKWPVARGTQSISSLLQWDHSKEHVVRLYPEHHNFATASDYRLAVSIIDSDWRFLRDHCIDGRIVFPATGYLMIVWRAMATRKGQPWHRVPVQFENVRITRPTLMNDASVARFSVQIIDRTGEFVLHEGASVVCTGRVSCPETSAEGFLEFQDVFDRDEEEEKLETGDKTLMLNKREIYKELRIRGYDYGAAFQGLTNAAGNGTTGSVQWTGQWISYADAALHLSLLALPIRTLFVPVGVDLFRCDPTVLFDAIKTAGNGNGSGQQPTNSNFENQKNLNREIQEKATTCEINKQHLQSEFCYFKDIAEKSAIIEPASQEALNEAAKVDATTIPFELMNGFRNENNADGTKKQEMEEEEKKVFFDVHFDLATQTLVTKGVEVRGLVPVNIPRHFEGHGLLLESYRFVPFDQIFGQKEEDFNTGSTFLEDYIAACGFLLSKVLVKFGLSKTEVVEKILALKEQEVDIEKFLFAKDQLHCKYAQVFKAILDQEDEEVKENNPETDNSAIESKIEAVKLCLTEHLSQFHEDLLNDGLLYQFESYSRPIFELIAENFQHMGRVKVLEIAPGSHLVVDAVVTLLKLNVIHKFEVDYTATRHNDLLLPKTDNSKNPDLKTIDWNRTDLSFLESAPGEYDLIIVRPNQATKHLWSCQANIDLIKAALKPGGFLLAFSRSWLTTFEQVLDSTEAKLLPSQLTESLIFEKEGKEELHQNLITNSKSSSKTSSSPIFQPVSCHQLLMTGTELALYRQNAFNLNKTSEDDKENPIKPSTVIHSVEIDIPTSEEGEGGVETWLETLKKAVKTVADDVEQGINTDCRLWIISRCNKLSGILGFVNCLRLEAPYGAKVRVLFLMDEDKIGEDGELIKALQSAQWNFETAEAWSSPPLRQLLEKDLAVNVYFRSSWGSFRFIRLPEEAGQVVTGSAYLSQAQRGDLSSLTWYQSELGDGQSKDHSDILAELSSKKSETKNENFSKEDEIENPNQLFQICDVYYSALNFKDVVIASGKIVPGPESALVDCVLGLEFSGRRRLQKGQGKGGERVMGMVPFKGIATAVLTHRDFLWSVPESWTLEEAATVPVVYITAYYALLIRGGLKASDSILVHSGAGGVGQAALNIARALGCREIFASVGTEEKRIFLKEHFGLNDRHIVDSRSKAFERHIKTVTKGRGVDVILNSLTGDKLQASLRCLAANGRFLEIGKYDMQMNSTLGLFTFLHNITFHGVGLDVLFREGFNGEQKNSQLADFTRQIRELITRGIEEGVVKPLKRIVYERNQVEAAFRHMATGRHIGKVLVKIRDEESEFSGLPPQVSILARRRTWFSPNKVYLIAGGLGGVGLELLYWAVLQGGRRFVLTSRSGLRSNFQRVFLERFKVIEEFCSAYTVQVEVSTLNIADPKQAEKLLEFSTSSKFDGSTLGGIFNLTLVLEDGLVERQTAEKFRKVWAPKVDGLTNLDRLTRLKKYSSSLEHFVAFSSFSSGRGNAGQTNYGYANSAMERIMEQRNADSLPGIAIQFGPIADVGIVAEHLNSSGSGSSDCSNKNGKNNVGKLGENGGTAEKDYNVKGDEKTEELVIINQDETTKLITTPSAASTETTANPSSTSAELNEETMKRLLGLEMQRIGNCLEVLNRLLPLKMGVFSSYVKYDTTTVRSGSDDEVIRQLCIHLNIDKRPEDECLGDIGLDSLAAVEIQQRLERDFNISLTLADVRKITVKELKNFRDGNRHNLKQYSEDIKKAKANLSRIRFVIPTVELTPLNAVTEGKPFYCLPPLKGIFDLVSMLVVRCKRPVIGLNWTRKMNGFKNIKQVVTYYHELLSRLDPGTNCDDSEDKDATPTYDLMATSFGALIVGLMAKSRHLSATVQVGRLIVFDLLPVDIERMTEESQLADYKVNLMFHYIRLYIPERICEQSMREILELNCEKERVEKTTELMRKCVGGALQGGDMAEIISASYDRASMMLQYHFEVRRKLAEKSAAAAVTTSNTSELTSVSAPALTSTCSSTSVSVSTLTNLNRRRHRRLLLEVMQRNEQLRLEYIKLVDREDGLVKGYERKLKSIFDVESFEEQFKDRYRMHLIRGTSDDLMGRLDGGSIQTLLDDIVPPPSSSSSKGSISAM